MSKVRSALVSSYRTGAFFTDANTKWENKAHTPAPNTPWCAFIFVPSQPVVATLGPTGTDELVGFLQLDLNYPPNSGEKLAMDKYEALKNAFTAGSRHIYEGQEVIVKSCGRSQGRVVDNFYKVVVTIYFYSHINR